MKEFWEKLVPILREGFSFWLLLSPLASYLAGNMGLSKNEGLLVLMGYSVPLFAVGLVRLVLLVKAVIIRQADNSVHCPRPGKEGNKDLTDLLSELSGRLNLAPEDQLRVTVFVPDSRTGVLVQAARRRWNGDRRVSDTKIRFGTCAVGHAYNRAEVHYFPDVEALGGFEPALRSCGLTTSEIQSQRLKDRRSFFAVPVMSTDVDGKLVVLAVVSADTATPARLPEDFPSLVGSRAEQFRRALLRDRAPILAGGEGRPALSAGSRPPQ